MKRPYSSKYLKLNLAVLFAISFNDAAHAELEVYAPKVEESILELESRNQYSLDHRNAQDGNLTHYLELSYGVNNWLELGIEGEIEKPKAQAYEYTASEVHALISFTEPNEYWMDAGVRLSAEKSQESQHANELGAKILLRKQVGDFNTIGNISFGREIGNFRGNDTAFGVSAKVNYAVNAYFEPGFEYYADADSISNLQGWGEQ